MATLAKASQFAGGALKQVGASAVMVKAKQIDALLPTLASVENATQQTGVFIVEDTLYFTVTTSDADGRTTTGVDIYDTGVLVTSIFPEQPGVWTGYLLVSTAGGKSYTARRLFSGGFTESAAVPVTFLDVLAPNQTAAALIAWYRTTESIRMNGTLQSAAGTAVTITSSSSLDGRTEEITCTITAGGGVGTSTVTVNLNGTNILVSVPTATNLAVTGTDLTLHFSGSYTNGSVYRACASALLDKTGNGHDFTQATVANMPLIKQGALGAPCLRFDGLAQSLACTTTLAATLVGGTDTPFDSAELVDIVSMTGTGGFSTFWCAGNTTDTDLPRVAVLTNPAAAPQYWRMVRVGDTATAKSVTALIPANTGGYLVEHSYDGANGRLSINTGDVIGGENPDLNGDQTGVGSITPTRIRLCAQQTQAGTSGFANHDVYELVYWTAVRAAAERIRSERYFNR